MAVLSDVPSTSHVNSGDLCHLSAQTVFSVLDHLTRWCHCRAADTALVGDTRAGTSRLRDAELSDVEAQVTKVTQFVSRIPRDLVAQVSYVNGAYTRSLLHYEQFLKANGETLHTQHHVDFLLVQLQTFLPNIY